MPAYSIETPPRLLRSLEEQAVPAVGWGWRADEAAAARRQDSQPGACGSSQDRHRTRAGWGPRKIARERTVEGVDGRWDTLSRKALGFPVDEMRDRVLRGHCGGACNFGGIYISKTIINQLGLTGQQNTSSRYEVRRTGRSHGPLAMCTGLVPYFGSHRYQSAGLIQRWLGRVRVHEGHVYYIGLGDSAASNGCSYDRPPCLCRV